MDEHDRMCATISSLIHQSVKCDGLEVENKRLKEKLMNITESDVDEFKDTKYPHLRVAIGGKGPPEGPVDNWLAEFEAGTTFVARHRNSNEVDYNLYYVLYKDLPEVILLKWQLPDGKVLDYYVDPVRFSKLFPERKILSVLPIKEEPQKEAEVSENEQRSDRSD